MVFVWLYLHVLVYVLLSPTCLCVYPPPWLPWLSVSVLQRRKERTRKEETSELDHVTVTGKHCVAVYTRNRQLQISTRKLGAGHRHINERCVVLEISLVADSRAFSHRLLTSICSIGPHIRSVYPAEGQRSFLRENQSRLRWLL